jgi:uncharacterized damage-inducible protein DinB
VRLAELRLLFDYDRWASRRVLNTAESLDAAVWSGPPETPERGLGATLVHTLGAHQRWRHGWEGRTDRPYPERDPLPSPAALREQWEAEWVALDSYLAGLSDADLIAPWNGWPLWQPMLHVLNHGTQHRSESALLMTQSGESTGDLDLILFIDERANRA